MIIVEVTMAPRTVYHPAYDLFVEHMVQPTYTDMGSIISESRMSTLVAIHTEKKTVLMIPADLSILSPQFVLQVQRRTLQSEIWNAALVSAPS